MMMNRQVGRYNVDLHSVMDQNTGNWVYMPIITDFGYAENQGKEIDHKRFYMDADSGVDVEKFLLNEDNLTMMYGYPENHRFHLTQEYTLTAHKRRLRVRKADKKEDRLLKALMEHLAKAMDDKDFVSMVDGLASANGEFAMAIDYMEPFTRENFNAACAEQDMDCYDAYLQYTGARICTDSNMDGDIRFAINQGFVKAMTEDNYANDLRRTSTLSLIAQECLKTFASLPKDLQEFIDEAKAKIEKK